LIFVIIYETILDLDHTFEDRLEVLLQRLKEYQTLGKEFFIEIFNVFLIFEEPGSKNVANLKKQIAQVRRSITKSLSTSSVNNTNNNDESIQQRTINDESSKLLLKYEAILTLNLSFSLVETISSLSPNVSSLNVTKNQSELVDIHSTSLM